MCAHVYVLYIFTCMRVHAYTDAWYVRGGSLCSGVAFVLRRRSHLLHVLDDNDFP
eukprot:GDKH01012556.1.p6 GENE.GDKH01012556.1~~GDKH01012556.1.p6  ORF type:complete len:55 (+),score=2.14 GDKH01012556.1:101-265(+)